MNVLPWLAMLRNRDIQVWAEGDRLRCSAPAGALTPELRHELKERKSEILEFLRTAENLARQERAIVPLQASGTNAPVFAVAGHNGDVFCFRALAKHLGVDQPFFGLQPPGLDGQSEPLSRVEDLAAYFAAQIRAFRPDGPYVIAGYCAGGTIAFELARQLLQDHADVEVLALFGSPFPIWYRPATQLRLRLGQQLERVLAFTQRLAAMPPAEWRPLLAEKWRHRRVQRAADRAALPDPVLAQRAKVERATFAALGRYEPGHFAGRLSLFSPSKEWLCAGDASAHWRSIARHTEEYFGPEDCNGDTMLREPYAPVFADLFRQCCARRAKANVDCVRSIG